MQDKEDSVRKRTKEIAAEFNDRGDVVGWFDELYKEADGDNEKIPWADLESNRFFRQWAEKVELKGNGRKALVVGCGLGDDARYLYDLGFAVTAFDISPTAIEWAKRLHFDTPIHFETMDLFAPFESWVGAFDFVLEIYTIQPLPLDIRPSVIDAVAAFVATNGELVVVTRGRENDEVPLELPWALSRNDLKLFEFGGLTQVEFVTMYGDEDVPIERFVVKYTNNG